MNHASSASPRAALRAGLIVLLAALLAGCAATRSPVTGSFAGPITPNAGAPKVSVLFLFRHLSQQHGFDTIPKLQFSGVKDFDNLFRDALTEISNISRYETFTELPDDVNRPERRAEARAGARIRRLRDRDRLLRGVVVHAAVPVRNHQPAERDRHSHALRLGIHDHGQGRPEERPARWPRTSARRRSATGSRRS